LTAGIAQGNLTGSQNRVRAIIGQVRASFASGVDRKGSVGNSYQPGDQHAIQPPFKEHYPRRFT
jgi:hypothetical protein